jgi:hypothetical protein
MKKVLSFCLLASTLVFVGCNEVTNSIARTHLQEILGGLPDLCESLVINKTNTIDRCDLGKWLVVEETAEGADRVVLKKWKPLIGSTGFWEYIGVDFSAQDWDQYITLTNEGDKLAFVWGLLTDGYQKYGYLHYEPADDRFFFVQDGNLELFSENVASVKDLELMGSKVEDQNAVTLGEKLSAQYGLSNERGQVVAKTLAAYNKLASKRSLTSEEKNQFSTNLLGVDYKTAERGIKSGDANEFQVLMDQAARTNGTTPEAVSAIIKDMVL